MTKTNLSSSRVVSRQAFGAHSFKAGRTVSCSPQQKFLDFLIRVEERANYKRYIVKSMLPFAFLKCWSIDYQNPSN